MNTSILCGNHSVEKIQSRKALILLKKAKDRRITTYNTHIWSFVYMSTHGWSRQIRWAVNSPFAFAFVSSTTESSDCYMSSYFCSSFLLCQRDNEISTQMHMQRKEEISNLPPQNHTKKKKHNYHH